MRITAKYLDLDVLIRKGRYADGSTALVLIDKETGETAAKATVCMQAYDLKPTNENHVFIKDYGENEGLLAALQAAGVVSETLVVHDAGWVHDGVVEARLLNPNAIEEIR